MVPMIAARRWTLPVDIQNAGVEGTYVPRYRLATAMKTTIIDQAAQGGGARQLFIEDDRHAFGGRVGFGAQHPGTLRQLLFNTEVIEHLKQPTDFERDGLQDKAPILGRLAGGARHRRVVRGTKGGCSVSRTDRHRPAGWSGARSELWSQSSVLQQLCRSDDGAAPAGSGRCVFSGEGLGVCVLPPQHPDFSGCSACLPLCLELVVMVNLHPWAPLSGPMHRTCQRGQPYSSRWMQRFA